MVGNNLLKGKKMKKTRLLGMVFILMFCIAAYVYPGPYGDGWNTHIDITTASASRVLTAAELSGGIVLVTANAVEVSLPDVCDSATGANVMIVQRDINETIQIGVTDTSDDMILDGTALGANQEIDSPGGAGDAYAYICLVCVAANTWASFDRRGTFVDGGAAD